MTNKIIMQDNILADNLLEGVTTLASVVKTTLGPGGRNAILSHPVDGFHITKDGVTVAQHVMLDNDVPNMAVMVVRDVARQTVQDAGDGTTTSIVLAEALFKAGHKHVSIGANPVELQRGIDATVDMIIDAIEENDEFIREIDGDDLESIKQVAKISANGDLLIGSVVAEAIMKTGVDGNVMVKKRIGEETVYEHQEGMSYNAPLAVEQFAIDKGSKSSVIQNPVVCVAASDVQDIHWYMGLLNTVFEKASDRPIAIIAPGFSDMILDATNQIIHQTGKHISLIKAPGFNMNQRNTLIDIAASVGAELIGVNEKIKMDKKSLESVTSFLGAADEITSNMSTSVIQGGRAKEGAKEERIAQVKAELEAAKDEHAKKKIKERLSSLVDGVGVIYVGGRTNAEVEEKRDRIDDALKAVRCALEEGIVAGGGATLAHASKMLDGYKWDGASEDFNLAVSIVREALQAPLKTIIENIGKPADVILHKVLELDINQGFNAHPSVEDFDNMFDAEVVDPWKVTKSALLNSKSISTLLLTCGVCSIMERPKEKVAQQPMMH